MRRLVVVGLSAAWLVAGCQGETPEDTGQVVITPPDAAVEADMAPPAPDAAVEVDMALEVDAAPEPVVDVCEAEGLARRDFVSEGVGLKFGDRAGDFTVQLLDGEAFTLSEAWSGCESYVFLNYFPDLRAQQNGPWEGDQLFATSLRVLVQESPRNVRYFFTSYEEDRAAREMRMGALRERARSELEALGEADAAYWMERLHFVTDRSTEMGGAAGELFYAYLRFAFDPDNRVDLGDRGQAPPPLHQVFAIDRFQRWDAGGSLAPFVGGDPEFTMAAYLGHFYNHKLDLDARVRAEAAEATTVELLNEAVTDRIIDRTVTLPGPDEMGAFDTLDFDIAVNCPHQNPFACSEWDRIARIDWCADAECAERYEIVRWITPYWRRGERRWVIDASPLLPLMAAGGEQTFRVEMGPGWERATVRDARVELRLRTTGGDLPVGAERAFTGGEFNADYNTREPFVFTPAADAAKVELVLILSGHGQTDGDNCAEWCDHRHQFTLNGEALDIVRSQPGIGQLRTCAVRAREGVPPGQWGNWAPGRAYWCPGLPVDLIRVDVTEHALLGMENTLDYQGVFQRGEPRGGNIALSAYVTWSR